MYKKIKENRKLMVMITLVIMTVAVVFLFSGNDIHADVGNNHRYGGDSGGSSSSSSDYGGSSSSDGSFGYLLILLFQMFGPFGFIVIGIILLVLYFYIRSKSNGNPFNIMKNTSSNMNSASTKAIDENLIIGEIMAEDPDFSADEFKQFASECFVTLQSAWTERDWSSIRPFESETLFNMHNRQLQEYINNGTINVMEHVNVKSTKIISRDVQGDKEVVSIALDAVMRDYIIDDKTKAVVEGNKTKDFYTTYRLEFIRTLGVKTVTGKKLTTTNCPNCGAPTAITSSGRCEYCDSVITTGDYSWVLNELTTL